MSKNKGKQSIKANQHIKTKAVFLPEASKSFNIEKALQEFVAGTIHILWASAFVSDDWLNQLKVYRDLDLKAKSGYIRMLNTGLLIDVLVQRVSDLIDTQNVVYLEGEVQKQLIRIIKLLELDEKNKDKGADEIYIIIRNIVDELRHVAKDNKITTLDVYVNTLTQTMGDETFREAATLYADFLIKTFEEHNFRQNLQSRLAYIND